MWVLSTYKRPVLAQRFLDSMHHAGPGRVMIDGGDPYPELRLPPGWRCNYYSDNIGYLGRCNQAFFEEPNQPWYGLTNDDIIAPDQAFWAERLIAAAGPVGFSSCSDGGWKVNEDFPCGLQVFGGDLVRAMGFWAVPGTRHCYADDAWLDLAKRFPGLWTPVLDIVIQHLHCDNGGMVRDETNHRAYGFTHQDYCAWGAVKESGEWSRALDRVAAARRAL